MGATKDLVDVRDRLLQGALPNCVVHKGLVNQKAESNKLPFRSFYGGLNDQIDGGIFVQCPPCSKEGSSTVASVSFLEVQWKED